MLPFFEPLGIEEVDADLLGEPRFTVGLIGNPFQPDPGPVVVADRRLIEAEQSREQQPLSSPVEGVIEVAMNTVAEQVAKVATCI